LEFNFGSGGSSSLLTLNGPLTETQPVPITIGVAPAAPGEYNIITGNLSGLSAASFVPPTAPNGYVYSIDTTHSPGYIDLDVQRLPAVIANPASQTVMVGNTATFTAAASGAQTPSVQWEVSTSGGGAFSPIAGATSTTYSFTASALENGNEYEAVFSNAAGSATSTAATLTIATAPVVTANPASSTVAAGSTATFTAAASGSPTPSVQWEVSTSGGTAFSPITGATSTTYSFTANTSENGNEYEAVFSNPAGSAISTAAAVSIAAAPVVTTNPSNQTVAAESTATFTAAASGSPTPSVQWEVSTSGGSTFSPVSGATSTTYSFTASASENGNEYEAVFSNQAGSVTSPAATLTIEADPAVLAAVRQALATWSRDPLYTARG
jgi:hypothetical protein